MKEITFDAMPENIEKAINFANEQLQALGCPPREQMQIDIAIDEIISNIAHYAYAVQGGTVTLRIETMLNPLTVILSFWDKGIPFNPLQSADPDVTLPASQRKIGGLGIYMVKKTMDEVSYAYHDGNNILIIRKKIENHQ